MAEEFCISLPKGVYKPGEEVKGKLYIKLKEDLRVCTVKVKARGFVKTHWSYQEAYQVPVQRSRIVYVNGNSRTEYYTDYETRYVTKYCNGEDWFFSWIWNFWKEDENGKIMPAGEHNYTFSFTLPQKLPPSTTVFLKGGCRSRPDLEKIFFSKLADFWYSGVFGHEKSIGASPTFQKNFHGPRGIIFRNFWEIF
jgi:hypothetical protein